MSLKFEKPLEFVPDEDEVEEVDEIVDEEEPEIEPEEQPQELIWRPKLMDLFQTNKIRRIVQLILDETLNGKTYTSTDALVWTKTIADSVNKSVLSLRMKRYKHVVQVSLAQQNGAGYKFIGSCRWDPLCDCHTSVLFTCPTFYCVCVVFGVYVY